MPLDLPQTVDRWRRNAAPEPVDHANIFAYMNGAGELYLGYRFRRLDVFTYSAQGQAPIVAEIYYLETPADAYGLLSLDWEGEAVGLPGEHAATSATVRGPTARALYAAGLLRMAAGNVFARIISEQETAASRAAIMTIGQAIARQSAPIGEPPLVQTLPPSLPPKRRLQPDRIRYFRSHLVLNSDYFLSFDNLLQLDHTAEAVTATYANPGKSTDALRILMVRYADATTAKKAWENFRRVYTRDPKRVAGNCVEVEDGWLASEVIDERLSLVFQAPDAETAQAALERIQRPGG